jgi:hypothetical protein
MTFLPVRIRSFALGSPIILEPLAPAPSGENAYIDLRLGEHDVL